MLLTAGILLGARDGEYLARTRFAAANRGCPALGQMHAARRWIAARPDALAHCMSRRGAAEDQDVQLGRNLAAAIIATGYGIGLNYARNKYAGQPVGQYRIALARARWQQT